MDTLTGKEMATLRAVIAKLAVVDAGAEYAVSTTVGGMEAGGASGESVGSEVGGDQVVVDGRGSSVGSGGSVASGSSWADEVEEEALKGGCQVSVPSVVEKAKEGAFVDNGGVVFGAGVSPAVVMPTVGRPAAPVVPKVKFGGMVDVYVADGLLQSVEVNFFRDYVRTPRVKGLKKFMEHRLGVRLPKECVQHLALATHAVGSVPLAFADGQKRVRGLAAVGDAALTGALLTHEFVRGVDVASMQALRSSKLSNALMARAYVAMGFVPYSVFPSGIQLGETKVGADLFEAVAGVLSMWREPSVVRSYLVWAGVIA